MILKECIFFIRITFFNRFIFLEVISASFVVFNGSFKSNLSLNAKQSVIEDGIMIHIETDTMTELKKSLQAMKPFRIECQKTVSQEPNNIITIEWSKEDMYVNKRTRSIIDNRPLRGVKSYRLANSHEYKHESCSIRWSEIYLIKFEEEANSDDNSFNLNKFAELCAQGTCTSLVSLLAELAELHRHHLKENQLMNTIKAHLPFKVALRVEVSRDQVGYIFGMDGKQITDEKFLCNLDNELIQLLHQANSLSFKILLELGFHVCLN